MTRSRYILASLLAPLGTLLIPALGAFSQLYEEVQILPDGSPDDAPMRAAGLFLVLGVPVLYLVGAAFYASMGHLLAKYNSLQLRSTLIIAAAAPWPLLGLGLIGLVSNNRSYATGALLLLLFGAAVSLFAVLGALIWWSVAVGRARSGA